MTAAESPVPGDADGHDTSDVLAEVEELIGQLTAHPDPRVGETATAVLDRIDLVHRTALTRLMGAIQSMAGDAFVNRLTGDPAIRLLLMSYDLLAVDRRTLAEEALDAVRGHLHAHGVDIELLEVMGGVVAVRFHGVPADHPAHEGARRDVTEALRAGFLGFQELEVRDDLALPPTAKDSVFLPRESLRRARQPVYEVACSVDEVPEGCTRGALVAGTSVLLVRVADELYAVQNACGESPLPLDYSTLAGTVLTCSWHACRYDVRTGARLDRPEGEHLRVFPVRQRAGAVEIAVGTAAVS